MNAPEPLISLRRGVTLAEQGSRVRVVGPDREVGFELQSGALEGLRMLAEQGGTPRALVERAERTGGLVSALQFLSCLEELRLWRLLRYSLVVDGTLLLAVEPMKAEPELRLAPIDRDTLLRLSRFAYSRREGNELLVETPLTATRTILGAPVTATLLARLTGPASLDDLDGSIEGLAGESLESAASFLVAAGVVGEVGADGLLAEERDEKLMQWESHDLLFHGRTRRGTHDYPVGAQFRFAGRIEPAPALEPISGQTVPLPEADLERLRTADVPFTCVLEQRRSIRSHDPEPITVEQLGEFLHRVARVRSFVPALYGEQQDRGYERTRHVYPCASGAYELELYLTVGRCQGLDRAIYHYDSLGHGLRKVSDRADQVDALLGDAASAMEETDPPQILITIVGRFPRITWTYSSIAYSLILKDVGVLYQTMYLVATAMGLAPCSLGAGDVALFGDAAGLDYFAQSSVGEFVLGTPVRAAADI